MTTGGFQVLARSPRGADLSSKVLGDLEGRFKIDLALQLELFESEGVRVSQVASMEEARGLADVVRELGADAVILDASGQELEVREVELSFLAPDDAGPSGPGPAAGPAEAAGDELGSTMFGGFHQPHAPAPPAAPAVATPPAAEDPDGLSIGFGATMMGPGSGAVSDHADELPDLDTTTPAGPPAMVPPPAAAEPLAKLSSLDNLDADNLVMLDGSEDEAFSPDDLSLEQPVSAGSEDFGPPTADEALELDDTSMGHHQLGVETSGEQEEAPPQAAAAAAPQELVTQAEEEADDELDWIPAEEEPEEQRAKPRVSAESPRISGEMRDVSREIMRTALQKKRGPLQVITDIFHGRPRIRILVGFGLALALGAIVPTCYASSVDDEFLPLLVDLSTAKAHGHMLQGTPSYRSPTEIEEQISSMQTRYSIYAFMMWAVVGGVIGFVFFRFTRE